MPRRDDDDLYEDNGLLMVPDPTPLRAILAALELFSEMLGLFPGEQEAIRQSLQTVEDAISAAETGPNQT